MFLIMHKKKLTQSVSMFKVKAPFIVKHAKPGQFVMLRIDINGERIPLTIAESNHEDESITLIVQSAGATTKKLLELNAGDSILDLAGPLGKPSQITGLKKVCVIGGGVGCAIAYPIAKALRQENTVVHTIIGFRNKELVFLEDEFKAVSNIFYLVTDNGSTGRKGYVTDILKELLLKGETYDEVIAIGPLIMMKMVSEMTKPYHIKTIVSMNPIMVDGTGMCGGCRVSVNHEMKFACVDGPEFDGHLVDFDEAIQRNKMYASFEHEQYIEACKQK
jgi:ferredoxin/flavodoxin---NADP+ reductase